MTRKEWLTATIVLVSVPLILSFPTSTAMSPPVPWYTVFPVFLGWFAIPVSFVVLVATLWRYYRQKNLDPKVAAAEERRPIRAARRVRSHLNPSVPLEMRAPPWLGRGAARVFGFICKPAERFDPDQGRPPILLAVVTICSLLQCGCIALALQSMYLDHAAAPWNPTVFEGPAGEAGLVYTQSLLFIVSAIMFTLWYWRLHARASAVATMRPIYSGGYAVAVLWLPFANIVGPIQTLSHLWAVLGPRRERSLQWLSALVLTTWWIPLLGVLVYGRIQSVRLVRAVGVTEQGLRELEESAAATQLGYAVAYFATAIVIGLFSMRHYHAWRRAKSACGESQMWAIERPRNRTMRAAGAVGILALAAIAGLGRDCGKLGGGGVSQVFGIFVYALAIALVGLVRTELKGFASLTAATRMYNDTRRPVVLLRSFRVDGTFIVDHITLEELIEPLAEEFGPMVGLGRPGESKSPVGAGRLYIPHHEWQDSAKALVEAAQVIVVLAGSGGGLGWEMALLQDGGHLAKTVFVPRPLAPKADWDKLVSACPEELGSALASVDLTGALYVVVESGAARAIRGKYTKEEYCEKLRSWIENVTDEGKIPTAATGRS